MGKHENINELLTAFALGELSQQQASEVRTHLAECPQCSNELKRLEALLECTGRIGELSADAQICDSAKQAIFAAVESEKNKYTSRPNIGPESIWRTIMKSPVTKLAAAAVIVTALIISINQFGKPVSFTTIAFADISEAMKNVPWMHQISKGFERGITGSSEQWLGFETKIHASKGAEGKAYLWNIKEQKKYEYDPKNNSITIDYANENNFPLQLSSPVTLLESMHKMFKKQGAEIVTKEAEYNGQRAQLQEISLSSVGQNNESHILRLYIQPDSKLLLAAQVKGFDSNGNIIMDGEITFSYPQTGPADIYDLGVPRDAQIISKLPNEDYQAIWDTYRQKRDQATKKYIAVIAHISRLSSGDFTTTIDVDYKSNQNHRIEQHSVFNKGQQLNKFWPEYKEQLGESFESLLAWTKSHYSNTGYISVYLYNGQYNFSTKRDDKGSWSKLRKDYSPGDESMPLIRLEDLAWPYIGKTGHIIEDSYAKENNLICIERLQQGSVRSGNVTLPGRFIFYLDPQIDYICRRRVREWRQNAEWQEDKNWLEGVEPEKIRDGSINTADITESIQATNGHWYPKIIIVKEKRIYPDDKEVPFKARNIKKVYIRTNPEFPMSIFNEEELPGQ